MGGGTGEKAERDGITGGLAENEEWFEATTKEGWPSED